MLKRKVYDDMLFWKEHKSKQALLVTGARQVGKTFLIREFGRTQYENFIELNLLENTTAKETLSNAEDSADLFMRLSLLADGRLVPGKTLIFIDEVQESKELVTAIKFLVDRYGHDYDFVLSGSMLGVELKDIRSFPVGYLRTIEMFPLSFEEFCWANGIEDSHLSILKEAFFSRSQVPDYLHDRMIKIFRTYLIVGGMPDVVSSFILSDNNIQVAQSLQRDIARLHKEDISKYNPSEALAIKRIYELIPSELNRENKRFKIASINNSKSSSERFSKYESNFLWLTNAGVALPVYKVSSPTYPLKLSEQSNYFKLYMMDVGLLTSSFLKITSLQILNANVPVNYGSIYESVVAQELRAQGLDTYYYNNKKQGELDFVVEAPGAEVLPIEVKSGKNYKRHNALRNVLNVQNYGLSQGYVLCEGNVKLDEKICYLPIYMTMFLGKLEE